MKFDYPYITQDEPDVVYPDEMETACKESYGRAPQSLPDAVYPDEMEAACQESYGRALQSLPEGGQKGGGPDGNGVRRDAPGYGQSGTPARTPVSDRIVGQYIANLSDGCAAGYKYFRFDQNSEEIRNCKDGLEGQAPVNFQRPVSVLVRGRADGSLQIYADHPDASGILCGEIPLRVYSDREWIRQEGAAHFPEGTHAIYFVFCGSGRLDLLRFSFA